MVREKAKEPAPKVTYFVLTQNPDGRTFTLSSADDDLFAATSSARVAAMDNHNRAVYLVQKVKELRFMETTPI